MEQEAEVLPVLDHAYWLKRWEDKSTPWEGLVKGEVDPVLEVVS